MNFSTYRRRIISGITICFFSLTQSAAYSTLEVARAHKFKANLERRGRDLTPSQPIAQSIPSGAIYLGMIGDDPIYQDPVSGLIITGGIGTLVLIFKNIGDAVRQLGENFFAKSRDNEKPTAKECDTAKKLLAQYERLAQKYGVKIPDKRLRELDLKRNSKTITSWDLPASLRDRMPARFSGKTLSQIESECK